MAHEKRKRLIWGSALATALSVALFSFYWPIVEGPNWYKIAATAFSAIAQGCLVTAFPVVLAMGALKLREQRRRDFHALGDDNTVVADPDGPRKLHEYLTAINSTEARIGLLQRSEPWPGDKP